MECTFAHGSHELLQKSHIPSNYRTKECKNFYTNLYCSYGERCQFYHSVKPTQLEQPKRKYRQTYSKSLMEIRDIVLSQIQNEKVFPATTADSSMYNKQNVLNDLYTKMPNYHNNVKQVMVKVEENSHM